MNDENVLAFGLQIFCEFEGEGREAAFVLAEIVAVDVNGRGSHCAFEVDEDALAFRGGGILETAAVGRDELVHLVVKVMPRHLDVGMRDDDALKRRIIEGRSFSAGDLRWLITPVAIDREDGARAFF